MGEYTNIPPGFRFFPSDEELVVHFLRRKAACQPCRPDIVPTVDLHTCDPWDLNGKALRGDGQWYFFATDARDRHTASGYWEPVGPDEPVTSCGEQVGTKKTLVFCVDGESGVEGIKTNWAMHEYHLMDGVATNSTSTRRSSKNKKRGITRTEADRWVICRVYETDDYGSQEEGGGGQELSCLDEVFLSMDDDLDEVSLDPRQRST